MAKTYSVTIKNDKKRKYSKKKPKSRYSRRRSRDPKREMRKFFFWILLLTLVVAGVGYFLYSKALSCDEGGCSPVLEVISATIEPKLKQDNGMTNILLVGLDTREDNPGLMNTDTMMIITIDYTNETAVMTSIPRDLWARYQLPNGNYASSKANGAYANGEWQEVGKGIETLKGYVETVIGEPIHYYAKVKLKGFEDLIDTIGGLDIDIPEDYTDAYPKMELPVELQEKCNHFSGDIAYCLFTFLKGTQHMDGQTAMIYARSRLLAQRGDFDRAAKQQRVIGAMKDKVLSSDTLMDPAKLWDIYNIVKDNIETTSFTINDIRAALNLRDQINPDEIGNVVLDPMLGHANGKYIYVGDSTIGRGYHIIVRDETYIPIQELFKQVRLNPGIYNEAPIISFYNATGEPAFEEDYVSLLETGTSLFTIYDTNRVIPNPGDQYKGIRIYKFTESEKTASEDYLKGLVGVDEVITDFDDGTVAYRGEDYVIVVGIVETEVVE